jgi:hypothetical protein
MLAKNWAKTGPVLGHIRLLPHTALCEGPRWPKTGPKLAHILGRTYNKTKKSEVHAQEKTH